jgi:hypothetical protein
MTTCKLILLLGVLLAVAGALDIGECVQRHSDGWSCLKCRDNYHLLEGSCYIDILGCTEYQDGAICKQCESNYMLVNNLCCDPVCLSKIFSNNKDGLYRKNYSDKAQALSLVLPFVQNGVLTGSTYKLEAVQSSQFLTVIRYELLYHIINSYQGSYVAKRAIIDYHSAEKTIFLVDWSEVKTEDKYAKIEKKELQESTYAKLLANFSSLYPDIQPASSYRISEDVMSEVKEYRVMYYDTAASTVQVKVFYKAGETVVLLVDEKNPIDTFKPYRKRYHNLTEIEEAEKENKILKAAVEKVLTLPIFQDITL